MKVYWFMLAAIALIGHFVIRWRRTRGLSSEEERTVAALQETAERLQNRIATLEQVLDAEVPGWRIER